MMHDPIVSNCAIYLVCTRRSSDLDSGSTGLHVYISGVLAVNDPWIQTWVRTLGRKRR